MTNQDTLMAKRLGPKDVPAVTIKNLRFEAIHWGKDRGFAQNGGYIAAFDKTSGEELWTLKIYDIVYDPELESDVQDLFIKSMKKSWFGNVLKIIDERGRQYSVNTDDRTVVAG
ncbi:MAG: hypothetical protein M0R33_18125 [Methylomonas sp.]|jgi:outer membrane protein assembly factor BamB|uniref:hypothetical protein n=1 Tax=Methylomonas sp. TaxID=418 RepID=UPI0025D1720C|nr:hypothetical protein [Methylomonas sp.]MCK9608366.1 hypothetical protein [Methylomonas sp.]